DKDARSVQLTISAKGFAPTEVVVMGTVPKKPVSQVEARLQSGAKLHGMVTDSQGSPVSGAKVYIGSLPGITDITSQGNPDARSSVDGSFYLDTVPAEPTKIFAKHPSYAIGWTDIEPGSSTTLSETIVMTSGGAIEGVAIQGSDPVAGLGILSYTPKWRDMTYVRAKTDSEGRYRLTHLIPGPIHVYTSVGEPPDIRLSRDVTVEEGQVVVADFDIIESNNVLEGTILLNGERPPKTSLWLYVNTSSGNAKIKASVEPDGSYEAFGLPAGEASARVVVFLVSGGRVTRRYTVMIEEGARTHHDINVTGSSITGRVVGLTPSEKSEITVLPGRVAPLPSLYDAYRQNEDDRIAWVKPDENGKFQLEAMPPGELTIRAIAATGWSPEEIDRGRMTHQFITVEEGENLEVELILE
ncbi:carboxypeptidase-like regulatory domain-containing protein, partial [Candidatus Hydrogenedentota bacterium]